MIAVTSAAFADSSSNFRKEQARELFGRVRNLAVQNGLKVSDISTFVKAQVAKAMANKKPKFIKRVARTILEESKKYEMDPLFLLAVIQNESSFRTDARGPFGEIGMMQLRPGTAHWVADRFHMKWRGPATLEDPAVNIKLGAAYFNFLRERFQHHGRLYLAAFNMGPTNTKRAVEAKHWPKIYPLRTMKRYLHFYEVLTQNLHKDRTKSVIALAGKIKKHRKSGETILLLDNEDDIPDLTDFDAESIDAAITATEAELDLPNRNLLE